ncbi:MAG: hypothetical protein ACI4SL_11160 [Candidatus Ornithospirochaeta sp.]
MNLSQYLFFSSAMVSDYGSTEYHGFSIYAVKRTNPRASMFEDLYDNEAQSSWWCGYVEIAQELYESIYLDKNDNPNGVYSSDKYELYEPHGGFTYNDEGIPGLNIKGHFLGWDYNHYGDSMNQPTLEEILNEGKKAVDSILETSSKSPS